ncbi:MAG TPA: sensor histidine kinase [Puia sp.]|jgi:two-component sensor histidine kinase|nr:sensor histidine kinase [Puia sp.]
MLENIPLPCEDQLAQLASQLSHLQAQYSKLLQEKEWLMKEVHHRVKNNLQLVISLLNMQTGYMKDEFALDAFGDIGSRIRAISLIHQRMYQEENNMAIVNMQDYISELISHLETSAFPDSPVGYQLDIAPIELDVSQSVPIGLILNEAITNAIRHAFPRKQDPVIVISMSQEDGSLIRLTVSDNGRGLPENFNLESDATMGLQLIKTLSDQLDGSLRLENCNGFTLTLQFARQQGNFGYKVAQHVTI